MTQDHSSREQLPYPQPPASFFRFDIQSLRGISVLAVVLFHMSFSLFAGGYLGVDVFFVISGFVITSSITRELEASGKFSLKNFYIRRFKRLYPALLGVVAITLIFVNYLLPIYESEKVIKTGLISLVGFSNNYLYLSSQNYFGLTTQLNPYLHTWSLGVEEQFYIVFSALLWIFLRILNIKTKRPFEKQLEILCLLFSVLCIVSFYQFCYQALWIGNQASAFYLLPSRSWQLLLGAIGSLAVTIVLAKTTRRDGVEKNRPSFFFKVFLLIDTNLTALKVIASALLVFVFIFADETVISKHPELDVIFRLLASFSALLLCLPDSSENSSDLIKRVMNWPHKFFGFLGDKSYSIYLIHWPLLALGHWSAFKTNEQNVTLLLLTIIGASWISWLCFERGMKLWPKLSLSLSLLFCGNILAFSDIGKGHSLNMNREWSDTQLDVKKAVGLTPCTGLLSVNWPGALCKNENPTSRKSRLYIIGDSHAGHILWGADKYATQFGYELVVLETRFPFAWIVTHYDRQAFARRTAVNFKHWISGEHNTQQPLEKLRETIAPNDLLVFSAYSSRILQKEVESLVYPTDPDTGNILSYVDAFQKSETEFSNFLKLIPSVRVVILRDTPILSNYPGVCLKDETKCLIKISKVEELRYPSSKLYNLFAANFPNVRVVDLVPYLCGEVFCGLRNRQGKYLYRDNNHLSPIGGLLFYDVLSNIK